MDENKQLVDPFVVTSGNDNKQTDPEQKKYLLLINWYLDRPNDSRDESPPEDQYPDYFSEWFFFTGRSSIRQFIIDNIADFNPKVSYVLVSGTKTELDPDSIPTVYQLFKDPRSSWNDPNLFPDNFNIDDAMEAGDDFITSDARDNAVPGTSMTSAENVAMMMSAEGIDITNKKEEN